MRTVWSRDPEARRDPSGLKTMEGIGRRCPASLATTRVLCTSKTQIVASATRAASKRLPSGQKAMAETAEPDCPSGKAKDRARRSEEHTSELQSLRHLVCRL